MKKIQSQVIISSIRAKVDGSIGLSMSTPELTNDEKVAFMSLQNINCQILIEPLELKSDLLEVKGETETKTCSQRLRGVIYVLYEQKGKEGDFEQFYKRQMEKIIDVMKEKLD